MPKIVFWSPDTSMTGNTHAIIATSTLMGIKHKAKCLLMQGHFNSRKIETSFTPYDELRNSGVFENSDIGIGALTKIVVSNKLTPATIKNYAKPVLKDRLDVLYGINSKEKEQYNLMIHNLQFITRKADEIYDLVFVDLPKTTSHDVSKEVLSDADVIVCIVNQDIIKLNDFFDNIDKDEILKNKSIIYVIGDYESRAKYNLRNIKSKYRIKEPIYAVPHNYAFADACNEGSIIDFFYKNLNSERNDDNGEFIFEVSEIVEKIIEESKIKDY
jgi:MinD-like ATPase involved in chromosome partitioning or flagellar assembly